MLIADCLFRRDEFVMKEMLQFLTAVKEPYFIRWWSIIYLLLRAPETSCASCNSVCSRITRIKSKLLSLLIFLSFSVREKLTNFRDVPSLRIDSQISHEILQRYATELFLHRWALQSRLNMPSAAVFGLHILLSFVSIY
jgi:hypothetical protein